MKTEIAVCFVVPESGAIGKPPRTEEWFSEIESSVKGKLEEMYPETGFSYHEIKCMKDTSKFLGEELDSDAFLIFLLNSPHGFVRPILQSGKPTLLINETYGGSGEYLLEYSRALKKNKPVIGVSTRKVAREEALGNVKLLDVVGKLKKSKVLFVVSPETKQLANIEFPLSEDLWSLKGSVRTQIGITPEFLSVEEFVENYYNHVDDEEAEKLKEKWIEGADKNEETEIDQIKNSAKLYYALKEVADDYNADAIAVDCITLYWKGFLEAWPCLSFMELYRHGDIVPICEADSYSVVSMLLMDYLAGLPGFVNDPAPDELTGEVVYYHCYAPVNFCGPKGEDVPYDIVPAHLGGKRASVYTKLPTGNKITVVGLDPQNGVIPYHIAEAVRNEHSEHACSTKLVGKTNAKALAENWRPQSRWHRVVFFGNWSEEIDKLATLVGMKAEREDQ